MRGGLSTNQQTLMPAAAEVLTASMAEAARRNHGHTTPLHVAATLLASPAGFLRQACVRSHPNSSHPLQCRALELCFSVALDRLPAIAAPPVAAGALDTAPQPSNALMAALKRAQAHQRRGCPEQQQQPLLAVKVELEQLIISILDDPGVSRVMREASFSSPAVKAAIEQSLSSPAPTPPINRNMYLNPRLQQSGPTRNEVMNSNMYVNPRLQQSTTTINEEMNRNMNVNPRLEYSGTSRIEVMNRNMYANPRLQQPGLNKSEEMNRIMDILSRSKKRNPILVGENEPQSLMNEIRSRFEKGELLRNIEVIQLVDDLISDKAQLVVKTRELGAQIEAKIGGGVVLDLGDLKWLVEGQQPGGAESGRSMVDEVAKVVARFGEGTNGPLWLIGTATCETYMRCQIYYPSMENDWDLQAVPIAPRSPFPGMFPRLGGSGILSSSVESLGNRMKSFQSTNAIPSQLPENLKSKRASSRCPQCTENYEQELAKLVANEYEKASSDVRSEPAGPPLPQWLQNAKSENGRAKSLNKSQTKDQEMMFEQKTEELQKKWIDTCLRLHPSFHNNLGSQRVGPPMTLYNPKLLLHQPLPNKLLNNKNLGASLQLNPCATTNQPLEKLNSPPRSPVRTDLVLGRPKITEPAGENIDKDRVKDLLGCISSEFQVEKFAKALDTDTYKKLLKGLIEKVWWQKEAASAVASIVTKLKAGNGKQRGALSKGDTWLLFAGPDRVGKKKMASVISEQICGSNPAMISLGRSRSDEEIAMNFRGKTVMDRVVEAVKRNPFSVIMLEDIDEANMLIRGSIKRAMERGRLADSYGREISLGNVIFILTANWLPDNFKKLRSDQVLDENKLGSVTSCGWQLRLRISEKRAKRRADWLHREDRLIKSRRELNLGLSLDLNLMADVDDVQTDGSLNSSDLTADNDHDQNQPLSITSVPIELADFIDDAVAFKPLETVSIQNEIKNKISDKFSNIVDDISLEVEEEALEKILGGVWLGQTSLEEWGDKVLLPSFNQIKTLLPTGTSSYDNLVVRLELDSDTPSTGDWLPSSIRV